MFFSFVTSEKYLYTWHFWCCEVCFYCVTFFPAAFEPMEDSEILSLTAKKFRLFFSFFYLISPNTVIKTCECNIKYEYIGSSSFFPFLCTLVITVLSATPQISLCRRMQRSNPGMLHWLSDALIMLG